MKALSSIVWLVVLLLLLGTIWWFTIKPSTPIYGLKRFSSCQELKNFLSERAYGWLYTLRESAITVPFLSPGKEAAWYSVTNVQVPTVDEPDIVKTDGTYIYSRSYSGERIFISQAFPPEEAKFISDLKLRREITTGVFVRNDKLVILSEEHRYLLPEILSLPYPIHITETHIRLYDISSKELPKLLKEISIPGNYKDARMYGNFVYVIIQEPAFEASVSPMRVNGEDMPCPCTKIYYSESLVGNYYYFTTLLSINLDTQEVNREILLLDEVATLYMSPENLYLTFSTGIDYLRILEEYIREVIEKVVPGEIKDKIEEIMNKRDMGTNKKLIEIAIILEDFLETLSKEEKESIMNKTKARIEEWLPELKKHFGTMIIKFSVKEGKMTFVANNSVPGFILNQFSMDEFNGTFRIATTTRDPWMFGGGTENNVYVLDSNLNLIGKLEGLEPNESIFAVRFIGEKGYVVTYRRVDPLLVVDLSNPREPRLIGSLKLPGFSRYLQPFDESHLIGIGEETDERGRRIGVKVSLFDVSDPMNPQEEGKYVIYNHTLPWDWDHKALLLDRPKQLLVLSLSSSYLPSLADEAFVFNVSATSLSLRKILNFHGVNRALYIDDILYLVSPFGIKIYSLHTLEQLKEIRYPS